MTISSSQWIPSHHRSQHHRGSSTTSATRFSTESDKIEITDRTWDGKGNTAKYKLGGESFWVTDAKKFTNVWVTEAAIASQLAFDKFFTTKKKFMKWANKQPDPTKWIPAKWLPEVDKPDPVMQEKFTWAIGDKFYQGDKTSKGKIWVQQGMYSDLEGNPNARSYQLWFEDEDYTAWQTQEYIEDKLATHTADHPGWFETEEARKNWQSPPDKVAPRTYPPVPLYKEGDKFWTSWGGYALVKYANIGPEFNMGPWYTMEYSMADKKNDTIEESTILAKGHQNYEYTNSGKCQFERSKKSQPFFCGFFSFWTFF